MLVRRDSYPSLPKRAAGLRSCTPHRSLSSKPAAADLPCGTIAPVFASVAATALVSGQFFFAAGLPCLAVAFFLLLPLRANPLDCSLNARGCTAVFRARDGPEHHISPHVYPPYLLIMVLITAVSSPETVCMSSFGCTRQLGQGGGWRSLFLFVLRLLLAMKGPIRLNKKNTPAVFGK